MNMVLTIPAAVAAKAALSGGSVFASSRLAVCTAIQSKESWADNGRYGGSYGASYLASYRSGPDGMRRVGGAAGGRSD